MLSKPKFPLEEGDIATSLLPFGFSMEPRGKTARGSLQEDALVCDLRRHKLSSFTGEKIFRRIGEKGGEDKEEEREVQSLRVGDEAVRSRGHGAVR